MSKTLTVYLAADTAKFRREMRQADDSLDQLGTRGNGLAGTMKNVVGPAMLGVGAAAGAMAVAVGVDAVKAFMDDEKAAASLARTMSNLGLQAATAGVEDFIDAQQRLTGVSDDQLRPAMDRLLRSVKDVDDAQRLLTLAMDVSAGTGKDLEAVTNALAKAADGNTTSLAKLGVGLDKATLKTSTFDEIIGKMSKTFDGQASVAAGTLTGKMAKLGIAVDELKESLGEGLVQGAEEASGSLDNLAADIKTLEPVAQDLGRWLGITAVQGMKTFVAAFYQMNSALDAFKRGDFAGAVRILADETANYFNDFATGNFGGGDGLISTVNAQAGAFEDARRTQTLYREETEKTDGSLRRLTGSASAVNSAMETQRARTSDLTQQLQDAAAKVNDYAKQITDFRNQLTGQIMSGVDLGAAFEQQGEEGGVSLLDAFLGQLTNAEGFANLLQQMKDSGASQTLIDQLAALGPDLGSKLATEMLDKGLVQTISDKWEETRTKIYAITSKLLPDFLLLGKESALQTMQGLEDKVEKNEKRLRKIGQDIGEPIGAEVKKKITDAANAAIAAAQAAAAAASFTVGGGGGGQPTTTTAPASTQTGRSTTVNLQTVLNNSNARGGTVTGQTLVFA